MKHKTQAVGLLHMVQAHSVYATYELALPLVWVSKKRLKILDEEDVILLGLDRFKGVLVKDGMLCADTILGAHGLQITQMMQEALDLEESKKHVPVMFVCANVKLNRLEVGQIIEVTDIEQVDVIAEKKKIAKGSLVCVNNEIAVKINKVLK
jgi:flagellar motor switch/type III secretory pathway protein FliN